MSVLDRPSADPARTRSDRPARSTPVLVVLLLVYAASLVVLALAGTIPGLFSARSFLTPGSPWSPLVLATPVALGVLAFLAFYWPRRTETRNYPLGVTAVLVASVLVLAVPTYWSCPGTAGQTPFWTQLAFALNIIVGDYQECGTSAAPSHPLALQLARFLGPLVLVVAAVGVVSRVFRAQLDRFRVRWARRLVLVTGLGETGLAVLTRLLVGRDEHTTVAVLVDSPGDPLIERARLRGARVVAVNPLNERRLRSLLCRGNRFRVHTIYALAENVTANLQWVEQIRAVAQRTRPVLGLPPRVILRVDDPWQAEYWRRRGTFRRAERGQRIAWATDALSSYEVTAGLVVRQLMAGDYNPLVLAGSSPMALSICAELAQLKREEDLLEVKREPLLSRLLLLGPQAAELLDQHRLRQERFGNSASTSRIRVDPRDPAESTLRELLDGSVHPAVILAESPSPSSSTTATFLAASNTRWTIFDWSATAHGAAPEPIIERLYPFGLTIDAPGDQPVDGWERAARVVHERYLNEHVPVPDGLPSHRHWHEGLSTFLKESNIRLVTTTISSAEQVGRTWVPTAEGGDETADGTRQPSEAELDQMARLEHESWLAHLRLAGWRRGPARDDRRRIHPALGSWEELDDDNRRRARRNVVSALSTLESLGYRSRPSPTYAQQTPSAQEQNEGWRVVTRRGDVFAARADGDWTWRNGQGGIMHGQSGDWRVVDDEGQQWSVSDEAFRQTYTFVAGNRWRRGGTVLARPALAGEVVESLEGRQTATAGDWVIKGAQGEQWVTSNEHFAASYEHRSVALQYPLDHFRRQVVQEHGVQVERRVGVAAIALVVGPGRRRLPGVVPPGAGGLTGRRDHRVDQDQPGDRQPVAGQRGAEARHGLGDQHHPRGRTGRSDDRVRLVGQGGARLVGQGDRHDRVPGLLEQRRQPVRIGQS